MNGVIKFLAYNHNSSCKTQNSEICVKGMEDTTFYGQVDEIIEIG